MKSVYAPRVPRSSTSQRHWENAGLASDTLACCGAVVSLNVRAARCRTGDIYRFPSKHDALYQCWLIVGPASQTVDQHWANIGTMYRVCWVISSLTATSKRYLKGPALKQHWVYVKPKDKLPPTEVPCDPSLRPYSTWTSATIFHDRVK